MTVTEFRAAVNLVNISFKAVPDILTAIICIVCSNFWFADYVLELLEAAVLFQMPKTRPFL